MSKENYYNGTRYYKCRSCGLIFTETFIIDKRCFESATRDISNPSVGLHKKCIPAISEPLKEKLYYGIGDFIGFGVKDFESE